MKKYPCIILFLLLGLFGQFQAIAQVQPDSTLSEKFLLDFVVPDMPAFKALGTDPSNLLRPSDIKKFATMLTPFYSNNAGVIPKNFAAEFAPWKIASKKWTLSEYTNEGFKRFLYRSSFSLGTINDTTKFPAKLAIGYRVSFLSERADIYRAPVVRNDIFGNSGRINQGGFQLARLAIMNYWVNNIEKPPIEEAPTYARKNITKFNAFLSNINKLLEQQPDPNLAQLFADLTKAFYGGNAKKTLTDEQLVDIVYAFGQNVDEYLENYKKDNWNAGRFDLALALAAQSPDTLISHAQFALFSVWATWAIRVHKGGQLLLGGNFTLPRTNKNFAESVKPDTRTSFNINARYYVGTQDFRGFFETQYKYKNYDVANKSLLLNLGAEFRMGNMFWVVASAGLDNYLSESNPLNKFVSSLDLRYFFNKPR